MKLLVSLGFLLLALCQCALAAPTPQFLTFRDGKFGVNFGGYHAEAGLGGLLTGNSAHGGLSASAGTPYGQQAGAGLGGILGGNARTAGGLYAGASAGHGVGASAALGGGLDEAGGAGGAGAESHAGGVSKKIVKLGQTNGNAPPSEVVLRKDSAGSFSHNQRFAEVEGEKVLHTELEAPAVQPVAPVHTYRKTVYKKKVIGHPHKVAHIETSYNHEAPPQHIDLNRFFDFQVFSNLGASFAHSPVPAPAPVHSTYVVEKTAHVPIHHPPTYHKEIHTRIDSNGHSGGSNGGSGSSTHVVTATSNHNGNFWNDIFNIPISTLTAVNQLLNNKSGSSNVHVEKHVDIHH